MEMGSGARGPAGPYQGYSFTCGYLFSGRAQQLAVVLVDRYDVGLVLHGDTISGGIVPARPYDGPVKNAGYYRSLGGRDVDGRMQGAVESLRNHTLQGYEEVLALDWEVSAGPVRYSELLLGGNLGAEEGVPDLEFFGLLCPEVTGCIAFDEAVD